MVQKSLTPCDFTIFQLNLLKRREKKTISLEQHYNTKSYRNMR